MKLSRLVPLLRERRGHKVVIRDPAETAEIVEAAKTHRELIDRADAAVEMAFRHAEEAAAVTGRRPPQRPAPRVTIEAT
jgi:hypothetical protein